MPDGSDFPTEADAIADVLLRRDVPKDAIALERLASSASENFWLSAELLRALGLDPHSFVAVTKPDRFSIGGKGKETFKLRSLQQEEADCGESPLSVRANDFDSAADWEVGVDRRTPAPGQPDP